MHVFWTVKEIHTDMKIPGRYCRSLIGFNQNLPAMRQQCRPLPVLWLKNYYSKWQSVNSFSDHLGLIMVLQFAHKLNQHLTALVQAHWILSAVLDCVSAQSKDSLHKTLLTLMFTQSALRCGVLMCKNQLNNLIVPLAWPCQESASADVWGAWMIDSVRVCNNLCAFWCLQRLKAGICWAWLWIGI